MGVKRIKPFDDFTQIFSRNEMEASAELARRLEAIIQGTFDQYEGLRQINDFRRLLFYHHHHYHYFILKRFK